MPARKKAPTHKKATARRKTTSSKRTTRKKPSSRPRSLNEALELLQRDLPPNLKRPVRRIQRGVRDLEKQIEKSRADLEKRWERQQSQFRRDLANVLHRMEKAVAPSPARKTKKASRKKASTRRASNSPEGGLTGPSGQSD